MINTNPKNHAKVKKMMMPIIEIISNSDVYMARFPYALSLVLVPNDWAAWHKEACVYAISCSHLSIVSCNC